MARYKTADIGFDDLKREYMDILNTIGHRKIESIKDLIPFKNGEYVMRLTLSSRDDGNISYNSDELLIAKFLYKTKKMVEEGVNSRWMYISEGDYLEFEREMTINKVLGIDTKLVHYSKPELEKPFEVKLGDILRTSGFIIIIATKVTPRTFSYKYFFDDSNELGDEIARIEDYGDGPVWMTECDTLIHKIE